MQTRAPATSHGPGVGPTPGRARLWTQGRWGSFGYVIAASAPPSSPPSAPPAAPGPRPPGALRLRALVLLSLSLLAAALALCGPALAATGLSAASLGPYAGALARLQASATTSPPAGATFDPDMVISDRTFRAVGSMSQAQVQSFLTAQTGILKTYAAPDISGIVKPASQIVWEAAQAFGVSPKVLLATLQKEQGLLTGTAPTAKALDWAMGCGVPDSGVLNTAYKGFGKQLWYGAQSLSVDGAAWHAGITRKCGDGTVSPANVSTCSLYTYTPWIAGNQLFWTVYWRYFGDPIGDVTPPVTTVTGADAAWHDAAVTLAFAATDNAGGSGVASTQYSCDAGKTWKKGITVTIAAPADHSADGVHKIAYRSVDDSGNVEATKSCKVRIDTTAPATADDAGAGWHDKAVTVTLAAADPKPTADAKASITAGCAGVAYTEYSRDGGATWVQGSSFTVAAPADHSSDGAQQILVRSTDAAGNVESAHAVTVKIDTRPPQPRALWAASVVRGHTIALRFSVSDPRPGSPTAAAVITIRTPAGRSVKTLVVRGPVGKPLSARFVCWLAKGSYRFTVSATDAAGNTQVATASSSLKVR
jgi:hypothetical protein